MRNLGLSVVLRAQTFMPLVEKCKALGRAMRIGTNHGSLSARILSYYGDTPRGMVESAFEFADICRSVDYHNFLFSMKASNPLVMVQARAFPLPFPQPPKKPVCMPASKVKLVVHEFLLMALAGLWPCLGSPGCFSI